MVDKGERIFLLEVFVDNVLLENCKVDNKPVKTCVRFKFLNYPFLEIMEDEYCKVPDETCNIKFQSGKSCLFSLRKNPQGSKKPPLNLHVNVVRMESETVTVDIGKTLINLSGSFTNLIQTANQRPDNNNPVSKIIKETYVLTNDKNQTVGEITIFVRLSCFGKIIVTQFQMSGLESKSFLFKAVSDIRGKQFEGSGDAGGAFESTLPHGSDTQQAGQPMGPQQAMMGGPGMGFPPGVMGYPQGMGPGGPGPGMMGPGGIGPGGMGPGGMGPGGMGPGGMGPGGIGPGGMGPGGIGPGGMGPGGMGPGRMGPGGMGPGGMGPGMMGPGMMGPPGMMDPRFTTQGMIDAGGGMPGVYPLGAPETSPGSKLAVQQGGLDYKNFSATVNGHVLNIKVLRKPRRLKQPEAVYCQRLPTDSSSSDSEDDKRGKSHKCDASCPPGCQPTSKKSARNKYQADFNSNTSHGQQQSSRMPICDCDIPTPPCLVYPPAPPLPPPKKKKKKSKYPPCPRDTGMYCKADCPLGFPTPPGLLPPTYNVPSHQTAVGGRQNFLITMEPRTEYPPIVLPPKPTCITVRDTQYDEKDLTGVGKPKRSIKKGGKKGKKGK